jgi:transposase
MENNLLDWEQRYLDLEQRYLDLEQRYLDLEQRYLDLEQRCAQLSAENQALREKLSTNSNNSSKPPSQDPNRPKRASSPSGKRPGGQPGHSGHARKMYPSAQVTTTVDLMPNACPNCSDAQFEGKPLSIEVRQVIELPEILPEITQYNIHTCRCGHCGKHVRADVPKEAERGFGPRLMGFVTMLTGEGHLTKRKICSITEHLGLKISLGALCNIHRLAGDLLQVPAETIQQFVLEQEKLNADESGWRIQKKRCWIWIGATPKATFFKIDVSRSRQAYLRIFGAFRGTLTTDRYGAYNEHEGLKQSCLAHIDRHFEKMSERPGIDGSFGRLLEEQLDFIFGLWAAFKDGEFSRQALQKKANEYVENIKVILIFTAREAKKSKSMALAHDLLGRFPTLWTFLFVEGVDPTNNLAERGLRPAVILRKLSGGNQSNWGGRFTERLMTVVCTLRQNAMNTFTFLTELFTAYQTARSPPKLSL